MYELQFFSFQITTLLVQFPEIKGFNGRSWNSSKTRDISAVLVCNLLILSKEGSPSWKCSCLFSSKILEVKRKSQRKILLEIIPLTPHHQSVSSLRVHPLQEELIPLMKPLLDIYVLVFHVFLWRTSSYNIFPIKPF